MQQTLRKPCSVCKHSHGATVVQQPFLGTRLPAQPARQRPSTLRVPPIAVIGAFSNTSSISNISNIASATIFALGALWLTRSNAQGPQDRGDPECPTCEGTGHTECFCQRWSDGDVGCSACNGTGKSICPTCGGGGKGVPLYAKIVVKDK